MVTRRDTNVRISATVRRSVRDKMRFLAEERTRSGKPVSESKLWSYAGALYVQTQVDMPGSRENVSKKITDQIEKQSVELQLMRKEIEELQKELIAQRRALADIYRMVQPIYHRLKPPEEHGG